MESVCPKLSVKCMVQLVHYWEFPLQTQKELKIICPQKCNYSPKAVLIYICLLLQAYEISKGRLNVTNIHPI